jgi:hypothetical protein
MLYIYQLSEIFLKLAYTNYKGEKLYASTLFYFLCTILHVFQHFFRRWADEGISSYSLHPGLVRTEIFSKSDFRSLKE